jgi:hypothetical protein
MSTPPLEPLDYAGRRTGQVRVGPSRWWVLITLAPSLLLLVAAAFLAPAGRPVDAPALPLPGPREIALLFAGLVAFIGLIAGLVWSITCLVRGQESKAAAVITVINCLLVVVAWVALRLS